jgi:hypothetical protein
MHWEPMSVDEFASYKREDGMKLVKTDGIWWAEVRPFFFRPLFPFREIEPWSRRYPVKAFIGGFMHLVPASVPATSCLKVNVYDDLPNYSLDILSSKRRKVTKDALARFSARAITDVDEFAETAYDVYKVFYQRTNYWYQNERIKKDCFCLWAKRLFAHDKVSVTGVYLDDKLSAVETSFRVEDIIFGDNLFTDDVSLRLNVVDFIMHRLREAAAATDARYFFSGLPTGVESLDNSKTKRGCTLLSLPAYCKINPLALSLAKHLMKDSYRKFQLVTAQVSDQA